MCLFAPIVPCKPAPAPSLTPSPTLTKPETVTNMYICMGLIRWSYCFWIMSLTFLLMPQACSSPSLSSCPPDPTSSPYSKETYDENPCYARCLTSSCTIVFSLLLVLNLYILIRVLKAAKPNPPGKSIQCV